MCDVCGNVPEWMKAPPEEAIKVARKKTPPKAEPSRKPSELPVPRPAATELPARPPAAAELIEFFKEWRRRTAQHAQVPAYVVLSDASLEDLCRKRPSNLRELLGVFGIGERKAELYGSDIFAAFEAFNKGARAAARTVAQVSPAEETIRLLDEGKTLEEIAHVRGRQLSTVVNMVADLIEKGRLDYRVEWVGEANHRQILEAVESLGSQWLKPLREALPPEISYEQIRLVVARVRSRKQL